MPDLEAEDMKDQSARLVVRQHERSVCRVPAGVRIASADASRVSLARTVGDGGGTITGTIVDASLGGVGLEIGVFLPRGVRVIVSTRLGGGLGDIPARVQRVTMRDRTPVYYLGLAFVGAEEERSAIARRILEAARLGESGAGEGAA